MLVTSSTHPSLELPGGLALNRCSLLLVYYQKGDKFPVHQRRCTVHPLAALYVYGYCLTEQRFLYRHIGAVDNMKLPVLFTIHTQHIHCFVQAECKSQLHCIVKHGNKVISCVKSTTPNRLGHGLTDSPSKSMPQHTPI